MNIKTERDISSSKKRLGLTNFSDREANINFFKSLFLYLFVAFLPLNTLLIFGDIEGKPLVFLLGLGGGAVLFIIAITLDVIGRILYGLMPSFRHLICCKRSIMVTNLCLSMLPAAIGSPSQERLVQNSLEFVIVQTAILGKTPLVLMFILAEILLLLIVEMIIFGIWKRCRSQ